MFAQAAVSATSSAIVEQHLPLAAAIAQRLKQRYAWLHAEDLYSYSLLGLTLAARSWRPEHGLFFDVFAGRKAMYLAIDEMRHDRVLQRESSRRPREMSMFESSAAGPRPRCEPVDPHGQDAERWVGVRDQLDHLLRNLKMADRQLLTMYYADGLTFAEIGVISGTTRSMVCVRHAAVLKTLKRQAGFAAQWDGREGGLS